MVLLHWPAIPEPGKLQHTLDGTTVSPGNAGVRLVKVTHFGGQPYAPFIPILAPSFLITTALFFTKVVAQPLGDVVTKETWKVPVVVYDTVGVGVLPGLLKEPAKFHP